MKALKFVKCSLCVVLSITLLLSSSIFAVSAETANEWVEIEPSEKYLQYLEDPDSFGGMIPPYYELSDLDTVTLPDTTPKASNQELPEKYDSRLLNYMTPVKTQYSDSTCSFFATMGNYETFVSKREKVFKRFSESHAKYAIAPKYSDGTNYSGIDRTPSGGVHLYSISPYLMNGIGPVSLEERPYLTGDTLVESSYVTGIQPEIQTTEIQVLAGLGSRATREEILEWLEELKSLIYEYGSVAITMTSNSNYSDSSNEYFYCYDMQSYHDHAVVAVGWDDTIPASKFKNRTTGKTPDIDGGIIFKNSWGNWWGESGYGYISYASVDISLQDFRLVTDYRTRSAEETVNTYAEMGALSIVGSNSTEAKWYGNKFYLAANEYVSLNEVSFYSVLGNMPYEVYVSPKGSLDRKDMLLVGSGTTDLTGYYSVPVDNMVLGGEQETEYFVVVKAYTGSEFYTVPTEGTTTKASNIIKDYIAYREDGVRKVVPKTSENVSMLTKKGLSWEAVPTGYTARDDGAFTEYINANIFVNSVTEPVDFKIDSIVLSPAEAITGEDITTRVLIDSDEEFTYSYGVYLNGDCIETTEYLTENTFTFKAQQSGEYCVKVSVKNKSGVTVTQSSDGITVADGPLRFTLEVDFNKDTHSAVIGGITYGGVGTRLYSAYVLKNGVVHLRVPYTTSQAALFTPEESGEYTVIVYVQDSEGTRVSGRTTLVVE